MSKYCHSWKGKVDETAVKKNSGAADLFHEFVGFLHSGYWKLDVRFHGFDCEIKATGRATRRGLHPTQIYTHQLLAGTLQNHVGKTLGTTRSYLYKEHMLGLTVLSWNKVAE